MWTMDSRVDLTERGHAAIRPEDERPEPTELGVFHLELADPKQYPTEAVIDYLTEQLERGRNAD